VFRMNVAKVDRDVAYVAIAIHVCCKCVYLDVAYVSHICCKCFIWMLHMFSNGFSSVFQMFSASVSDLCFKCFICLQTYIVNVLSQCFKSRSGVAHVAMALVASE
jgi:hypothetical protein